MLFFTQKPEVSLEGHLVDFDKYSACRDLLIETGKILPGALQEAFVASPDEILTVHSPEYLADLRECAFTFRTEAAELFPICENPRLPQGIVEREILHCGGTLAAARHALLHGGAMFIGGGHHHASQERAEGFCLLNDLAIAIRVLQAEGKITRAVIVDLDVHQGNGQAKIFFNDTEIYTFSMHQEDIYPCRPKLAHSTLDLDLEAGLDGETYLQALREHLPRFLNKTKPQLIVYQAGVDPSKYDQLGNIKLSKVQMAARDAYVISEAQRRAIPIVGTGGGGYTPNRMDTIEMHSNTCVEFLRVFNPELLASHSAIFVD